MALPDEIPAGRPSASRTAELAISTMSMYRHKPSTR